MQHPLKQPCNAPATLVVVRLLSIALFITHAHPFTAHAAVPLDWTAHPGQPAPVTFDRFHGETLDFRCTFQGFSPDGQTVFGQNQEVRLFWQTNGMETSWWSVPAAVSSNVIAATWSPDLDPGADRVLLFFGAPSNAYAAAVLRLRHSPGFTPATPPPPAAFTESDPVFSAWRSTFQEADPVFSAWHNTFQESDPVFSAWRSTFQEADPVFSAWRSTFQETDPVFSTWLSTNDQRSVIRDTIADFAATGTVHRSASYGTPTRWTDASGCVWEVSDMWSLQNGFLLYTQTGPNSWVASGTEWDSDYSVYYGYGFWFDTSNGRWVAHTDIPENHDVPAAGQPTDTVVSVEGWGTFRRFALTNLVGRVALTNDIQRPPVTSVNSKTGAVQLSASDVSAYSAASGAALANTVDAWQSYWDGDEVRVTITNYFGSAGQPHLYIEQKVFDEAGGTNYYRTVWDEVTRQNILLARIVALETALAQKADRAWGFYDSHTGEFSPDGYTQVSSSNILLAAGMSYQKTITSGGEVWTLTATEPTQISGVGTNGFFRIEDGDGNALFEIVKGTRRTAAATSRAVSMAGGVFTIQYAVVADEHPVLQICSDLSLGDWADEGSTQRATVEWSGTSGNYTATVTPVGSQPKLFARATYEVGGNTYIKNNVASSLDRVVVKGTEYTVSVETVNGRKLMVLEVAP